MIGEAAKHNAMFAKIRSTLALLERSKNHTDFEKAKLFVDVQEELQATATAYDRDWET